MGRLVPRRSKCRTRSIIRTAALLASLSVGARLMVAGIASPGHAWLGLFSLLPLFLIIRWWRPVPALFGGTWWGISLAVFSAHLPDAAFSPTTLSYVLLVAVPAVYAFSAARVTRWIGFNPFVLGFGWMGVELALGHIGLHRGLLAGGFEQAVVLRWIGQALGYILVAFVIASLSASLVSLLSHARLVIPAYQYRHSFTQYGLLLSSQTFFGIPLYAIRPASPRAPPCPTHR